MSFQAYLDNVETKTGKTPNKFIELAKQKGCGAGTKASEIVSWLKEDFDLGHGHAMAMVHIILNGSNIGGGFAYRQWNAVTTLARGFARGGA